MKEFEDDEFASLLSDIYDAALDPSMWPAALARMNTAFGEAISLFYIFDTVRGETVFSLTHNMHPEFERSFAEYYAPHNPYPGPTTLRTPVAKAVLVDDVVPAETVRKTEFFNDWLHPQNVSAYHVASKLLHTESRIAVLAFSPQVARYEDDCEHYRRKFEPLVPHLSKAVAIQCALAAAHQRATGPADALLESFDHAVIALDRDGGILSANGPAERLLMAGDALYADRWRRLRAARFADNDRLQKACAQACDSPHAAPDRACVRVKSMDEARTFLCWPIPMDAAQQGAGPLRSGSLLEALVPPPAVALLITPVAAPAKVDPALLSEVLGLTAAEARLASALVRGMSLAEYAEEAGLSRNTARVQLAAVFTKTGTNRQAELVARIASAIRPLAL